MERQHRLLPSAQPRDLAAGRADRRHGAQGAGLRRLRRILEGAGQCAADTRSGGGELRPLAGRLALHAFRFDVSLHDQRGGRTACCRAARRRFAGPRGGGDSAGRFGVGRAAPRSRADGRSASRGNRRRFVAPCRGICGGRCRTARFAGGGDAARLAAERAGFVADAGRQSARHADGGCPESLSEGTGAAGQSPGEGGQGRSAEEEARGDRRGAAGEGDGQTAGAEGARGEAPRGPAAQGRIETEGAAGPCGAEGETHRGRFH